MEPRWTPGPAQEDTIAGQVLQRFELNRGKRYKQTPIHLRNPIWHSITRNVNELGVAERTVDQIKKKWDDMKRIVKAKLGKINQQRMGHGPTGTLRLTRVEEKVATIYTRGQVEGVSRMDLMNLANEEENPPAPEETEQREAENITEQVDNNVAEQPDLENPRSITTSNLPNLDNISLTPDQLDLLKAFMEETKLTMAPCAQSLESNEQSQKTMTMLMWREFELRNPTYCATLAQNTMLQASTVVVQQQPTAATSAPSETHPISTLQEGSEPLFASTPSHHGSTTPDLTLSNDSLQTLDQSGSESSNN